MANLRELRNKLNTVKSTRKLTAAMKLVAGVKLRKAEQKAESSRGYAEYLSKIISGIRRDFLDKCPEMLVGRESSTNVLLVVFGADKGLCGNFNYNVIKGTKQEVARLLESGKKVKVLCLCQKVYNTLSKMLACEVELFEETNKTDQSFDYAARVAKFACQEFLESRIDVVRLLYTKYVSAMNREVRVDEVVPISQTEASDDDTMTVFEPSAEEVFNRILEYNVAVQMHQAALESMASEQSARMTAMDSATRNADEIIAKMALKYNRLRQSMITLELVEVISGAEALNKG